MATLSSSHAHRVVPRLRRLYAGLFAVGIAIFAQLRLNTGESTQALVLYAGASVLFVWAVGRRHRVILWPDNRPGAANAVMRGGAVRTLILGVALSIALGAVAYAWTQFDFAGPSHTGWYAYAGAIAVMLAGVLVHQLHRPRIEYSSIFFAFCGVILLAAVVRLVQLETLPFGTWYDEAANGLEALRVVREPNFRPVYTDGVNSSGHYLFLIALFFDFFGEETASIRLISAIMGIGLVAAGYGVGRLLMGPVGGLWLAALLAVSSWAVNFSRIGMYNISTPFLALAALFFVLRAVRWGRLADFVLAGAAAGLGMIFYSAYFLFLPILGLFGSIALWQQRGRWRVFLPGLLVALVGLSIVVAPLVKYAYERPESYFSRVRTTSLLDRVTPDEQWVALGQNAMKHLGMFHVRGDPNGRHNLPGRPMLDPVSSALMVLGLAVCAARWREPVLLVLPVWLGAALMGGILSLDFESPQSLRSIGAIPPAYLLATLPIVVLAREWTVSGAHHLPKVLHAVLVMGLLPIAFLNLRAYFVEQAGDFASWNAFSTPETIAARLLERAGPQVDAYVISLYEGHPTIRFLAPNRGAITRLETTDSLPIFVPPEQEILLIVDAERRYFFDEAQALYPDAEFQAIQPPFGGSPVIYAVRISPDDQRAIQGLETRYLGGATWEDAMSGDAVGEASTVRLEPLQPLTWPEDAPVALPFWAEREGVLAVPSYGPHLFYLEAPGWAELFIGEERVAAAGQAAEERDEAEQAIVLAKGLHALRMRAEGGEGDVRIYWRPPDRDWELLPNWLVFHRPVQARGLVGRYFSNGEWRPPEAFAQVDGRFSMYFHVLPLPRPYTVEWSGKLHIPISGDYGLGVQSTDESTLILNGAELAHSQAADTLAMGRIYLEEGLHDIRILYADRTHHTNFSLYWEPPGSLGGRQVVPSEFLLPPQREYARMELAHLGEPDVELATRPVVVDALLDGQVRIVAEGLDRPTALARAQDGAVWVAEPHAGRIRKIGADGSIETTITRSSAGSLREPYAVATDRDGNLLVLDPADGAIYRFAEDGAARERLPIDPELLQRSRGLFVAADGSLWVAATVRGEIFHFGPDGRQLGRIAHRAGGGIWQEGQPVAVAVLGSEEEGAVFVADAGIHKLAMYNANGQRQLAWNIPRANTYFGPQLAIGPDDLLYRTSPEEGIVAVHRASGEYVGAWLVRTGEIGGAHVVGIAVEPSGAIWLVDSANGRLLLLEPNAAARVHLENSDEP